MEQILQRTLEQVTCVLQTYPERSVETLYVGGGTPSALDGAARERMLETIQTVVTANPAIREVTVEVNPEDTDHRLLAALALVGVNRISLGIQTLRDPVLARIGRVGGGDTNRKALSTMRDMWSPGVDRRTHWSADLIVGIPGYTLRKIREDLQKIIAAGADHLSVYELSLEKNTVLGWKHRRNLFQEMPASEVLSQLHGVRDFLSDHGFSRYEVSSYAREDGRGIHNSAYWDMAPHLGCGPGAVGTMPEPWPVRHVVTGNFRRFLESPDFGMDREPLPRLQFMQEVLMMGMRLQSGLDDSRFAGIFGVSLQQILPETLHKWHFFLAADPEGTPPRWVLPETHRDVLDSVILDAFRELDARVLEDPSLDRPWSK